MRGERAESAVALCKVVAELFGLFAGHFEVDVAYSHVEREQVVWSVVIDGEGRFGLGRTKRHFGRSERIGSTSIVAAEV